MTSDRVIMNHDMSLSSLELICRVGGLDYRVRAHNNGMTRRATGCSEMCHGAHQTLCRLYDVVL
jgi:hypothetical protein